MHLDWLKQMVIVTRWSIGLHLGFVMHLGMWMRFATDLSSDSGWPMVTGLHLEKLIYSLTQTAKLMHLQKPMGFVTHFVKVTLTGSLKRKVTDLHLVTTRLMVIVMRWSIGLRLGFVTRTVNYSH